MSENIVDEHGKPTAAEPRGNGRAQWAAVARGTRENMRGKFWIQKRADLFNEAEAILERAQVAGRGLTAGEDKWYEQVTRVLPN